MLDRWSEWKKMKELPAKVAELERRLAALEVGPKATPGRPCKACGEPAMRRIHSRAETGPFAVFGGQIETWRCEGCGDLDEVKSRDT